MRQPGFYQVTAAVLACTAVMAAAFGYMEADVIALAGVVFAVLHAADRPR